MRGLQLLVLAALLLLVSAHAARDLTSEGKEMPIEKLPAEDKSCGTVCPAGAKCIGGTCECGQGLELCVDEGRCALKGKCPPPVVPPEPECSNNASTCTFVLSAPTLEAYCLDPAAYCAVANASSILCDLEALPTFDVLPVQYQALLAAGGCFLNGTLSGQGALDPWCACFEAGGASDQFAFAVLNFLIGTSYITTTTGEAANITARSACADAPFVPFKDTYLCDRPGSHGLSCSFSNVGCPWDTPISQWNFSSLGDSGIQCAYAAFSLAGAFSEDSSAVCLPSSQLELGTDMMINPCQLQNCQCPDPCPTNAWSLTYPVSFWKDSYCPNEDGIQAGVCATTNPDRPATCDLDIPLDAIAPSTPGSMLLPALLATCPAFLPVAPGSDDARVTGFDFRTAVCECLKDEATANKTASSINAVLNFDFTTGTIVLPTAADAQPPEQCANATFVPARNLYVCDAEGVQPGACECASMLEFSAWESNIPEECFEFVAAAAEGGKCLAPAVPAVDATIGSLEPRCRISTCPCPLPTLSPSDGLN